MPQLRGNEPILGLNNIYAMSWKIVNLAGLEYHCRDHKALFLLFCILSCDTIHYSPRSSLKRLSHPHAALTSKHVFDVTCIPCH
jgi:hypothetical protein